MISRILHKIKTTYCHIFGYGKILLYHRIEDCQSDPLQLCVSKANFKAHIEYLQKKYRIIPLTQMVENIAAHRSNRGNIAITFDDGYVDNLSHALPILAQYNIPATIFITSNYVTSQQPFYWDVQHPSSILGKCVNIHELQELSCAPVIEIGAHTMSHPHLGELTEKERHNEILGSKQTLETYTKKPIRGFAYPFGITSDCTDDIIELVKKAGYVYACANSKGYITSRSNLYRLPRILVRNWDIEKLKKCI